ncbi:MULTISPECIES: ABC transporter substrate-binding protein [Bradyrhizobium]|uniref:ABC transporter substrate-binding protein n=1 Tax=Bradyrhizobium TaxID=374 RepID=UPI001EDA2754|nr:ABC transporter substrate-binding protein [Bradyrhizobium zhengyangense]MCG2641490.1 ABC transporter substrate-binding protein [Bradyrhizobium zhengyangense]
MQRRHFITFLFGAAAARPSATCAQQSRRMRRVGVLMQFMENDEEGQLRARAFRDRLEASGWRTGTNLLIDFRWGVGDLESTASNLMKFAPEVILANGDQAARAAQSISKAVPIVFIGSSDPVIEGFVQSIAHPAGNMTGFSTVEPTLGPKWLELLTEVAPRVTRVSILLNPNNSGSVLLANAAAARAKEFGLELAAIPIRSATEIEAAAELMAREPGSGLIVPPDPTIAGHRKLIVGLAARYRLPAAYALRSFVVEGGLISYGISIPELFQQAADYINRILNGEKPAELPVQQPSKFELAINLKAAKAVGIDVPPTLLARADEVIE